MPSNKSLRLSVSNLTASTVLFLAALPLSTAMAKSDEVEIIETWPTCTFERLGNVESRDGREVTASSGGSKRANVERAEKRLRRLAEKQGAERIVLTRRNIQRDGSKVRYVHLMGVAIGPCSDEDGN